MTNWKLIGKKGGYSLWELPGKPDIFQATKGDPPTKDGGYYTLTYIMDIKSVLSAAEKARGIYDGPWEETNENR